MYYSKENSYLCFVFKWKCNKANPVPPKPSSFSLIPLKSLSYLLSHIPKPYSHCTHTHTHTQRHKKNPQSIPLLKRRRRGWPRCCRGTTRVRSLYRQRVDSDGGGDGIDLPCPMGEKERQKQT